MADPSAPNSGPPAPAPRSRRGGGGGGGQRLALAALLVAIAACALAVFLAGQDDWRPAALLSSIPGSGSFSFSPVSEEKAASSRLREGDDDNAAAAAVVVGGKDGREGDYDPTAIWTTLLTNRAYFGGLLVLHHSLRRVGSRYALKVIVTRDVEADTEFMRAFEVAGIPTIVVDGIEPKPRDGKPIRGTWEKLAAFGFTEYERVTILDSDQVILKNIDDMMTVELPDGWIASTHACTCNPRKLAHYSKDWIPENCAYTAANVTTGRTPPLADSSPANHHLLNSGTVVLRPSRAQLDALVAALDDPALDVPSMRFFDQDLLTEVYRGRWLPLPYWYNALKPMRSCHAALWRDEDVRVLHYILDKPWRSRAFDRDDAVQSTHRHWWDAFAELERAWHDAAADEGEGGKGGERARLWRDVVVPNVAQE
ncbi:nucleotide-diphospho-sugar transferase [Xylariaceae sp. FL0804]|nr:nucleotide-diphospho-sugar transferase [Xylariaceae sp. FL0804]